MKRFDAILIPGGGVREGGELPIWSMRRLDKALEIVHSEFVITLSAGTTHKPTPLDRKGAPIFESVAAANYLVKHGLPTSQILTETSSYDTIGNAFFSKVIHVDPLGLRNLLIVTSDFHMPRTKTIFSWVYNLENERIAYQLDFEKVSDNGIDEIILDARKNKEAESLSQLKKLIPRITTLKSFHKWLFTEHNAYSVNKYEQTYSNDEILSTY